MIGVHFTKVEEEIWSMGGTMGNFLNIRGDKGRATTRISTQMSRVIVFGGIT